MNHKIQDTQITKSQIPDTKSSLTLQKQSEYPQSAVAGKEEKLKGRNTCKASEKVLSICSAN